MASKRRTRVFKRPYAARWSHAQGDHDSETVKGATEAADAAGDCPSTNAMNTENRETENDPALWAEDRSFSLLPSWYLRIWAWLNPPLRALFQISIVLAALSFFQRQEPVIERTIDHTTKVLSVGRAGLSPAEVRIYAVFFELNTKLDANNHLAFDATTPIKSFQTRGFVAEKTLWFPWSELSIDLKQAKTNLDFAEWQAGEIAGFDKVYCFCG